MSIGADTSLMKDSLLTLVLILALAALSFVSRSLPADSISSGIEFSQEAAVIQFNTFRVTDTTTDEDIMFYLKSLSLSRDEMGGVIGTLGIPDERKTRVLARISSEQ